MNRLLEEEAIRHGDRVRIVSVKHLEDLKNNIEHFKNAEELNGFQKWIANEMYQFDIPDTGFEVNSIILMALYHPFSANIEFIYQGKKYHAKSLVRSEFEKSRQYLRDFLNLYHFHLIETHNLPLKRLAVQSGLAIYGRNNITYVEELGSNISYLSFYSDIPCEKDEWREQVVAKICNNCKICINACPTGAIRKDRFLIDNQKCLSAMNEVAGEFPDWLPNEVHHTLYDCLRCQERCPMNASVVSDQLETIYLSEEETLMLLEGKGANDFSQEFLKNVNKIGLFDWAEGLPRNLLAIIQAADQS